MSVAQTLTQDRRASARRRVLKRGKAVFNDNKSVIDCMIRDLSEGGARLSCSQAATLPDSFILLCVPDRDMRDVRVAWRHVDELGVQFLSEPRKALRLLV